MSEIVKYGLAVNGYGHGNIVPNTRGQFVSLSDYEKLKTESDKLKKKCEVLSEGLKFYKNPNKYHGAVSETDCVLRDGGQTARKALEEAGAKE